MLNQMDREELNEFLEKPVFVNTEMEAPISLDAAAKNLYSDTVLSQVYKICLPVTSKKAGGREGASRYAQQTEDKLISFNRNEIFFNNRKSVILSLRDISDI